VCFGGHIRSRMKPMKAMKPFLQNSPLYAR
jgi:hypothetical protein